MMSDSDSTATGRGSVRAGAAGLVCLAFETHSAHATHSRSRHSGKEAEEQAQKCWVSSGKSPSTAGFESGQLDRKAFALGNRRLSRGDAGQVG